jgi:hypothetical protein
MTKLDDLQTIANILRRDSMISKECWDEDGNECEYSVLGQGCK